MILNPEETHSIRSGPDINWLGRSVLRNLVMPIQTANYQRSPTTVSNVTSRIPIINCYSSMKQLLNLSSKKISPANQAMAKRKPIRARA